MNIFITIGILLAVCYLLKIISKKIKIPDVVVFIVAGLIIGIPQIERVIIQPNTNIIFLLGEIGFFVLMFFAGAETSWRLLYKERKDASLVAFFGALLPFALGFIVFYLLGFPLLVSLMIGISMSITAEATKAKVLLGLRKLKTKLAAVMMGAGIIDDLIGLFLFLIVALLFNQFSLRENLVTMIAIFAFFAGIFLQTKIKNENFFKSLEPFLIFVLPFFFIAMGLHFSFNSLILNPFLLILIIALAIVGKIGGVLLTKPFTKFEWKQLFLVGWGMNSRGAVELGLAMIAFKGGLLTSELYSSIVVMALTTTLIFPFVITRLIKKDPKIMNR